MSMPANIGLARLRRQVPLTGESAAARARLKDARADLHDYNGAALDLAAEVLAAMHLVAKGRVPDLRCDRLPRYRDGQFLGQYGMPVEDLAAIALESELGREVVLAGARVLLAAIGHQVTPIAAPATSVHEALALLSERATAVVATGVRAVADGEIDAHEDAALADLQADLQQAAEILTAARAAARVRR